MDEHEIEERVEELTRWYGAGGGPDAAQWRRVVAGPQGTPVTLINFFKLRSVAEYADVSETVSGIEAMMRYAAVSGPALERVGGRFLLTGPFDATFIGEDEDWDLVAIGTYPDRAAVLALFADEAYRAAWAHRAAAVARQRVLVAAG
jgi:uncharacterized protein (DUF1330 family)